MCCCDSSLYVVSQYIDKHSNWNDFIRKCEFAALLILKYLALNS